MGNQVLTSLDQLHTYKVPGTDGNTTATVSNVGLQNLVQDGSLDTNPLPAPPGWEAQQPASTVPPSTIPVDDPIATPSAPADTVDTVPPVSIHDEPTATASTTVETTPQQPEPTVVLEQEETLHVSQQEDKNMSDIQDQVMDTPATTEQATPAVSPLAPKTLTGSSWINPPIVTRSTLKGNSTLKQVIETYFDKHDHTFKDTYPLQGDIVTYSNGPGLWEEGGFNGIDGAVRLVAGPHGERLEATMVYTPNKATMTSGRVILNGRHALMEVKNGCLVVLGGRKRNDQFLIVLRITSYDLINDKSAKNKDNVRSKYTAETIATWESDTGNFTLLKDVDFALAESELIRAALLRLNEVDASTACYVKPYRYRSVNTSDYNDAIKDPNLVNKISYYKDLKALYDQVEKDSIENLLAADKREHSIIYTSIQNLDPLPEYPQGGVVVFVIPVILNAKESSSKAPGHRKNMYGILLTPDQQFWYIDTPDQVKTVSQLKAEIISRNSGPIASSLRRMTIK